MSDKKSSFFKSTHLLLLASFAMAWGVVQVIHSSLINFSQPQARNIIERRDSPSVIRSKLGGPEDTLLIESIVAIVQNYYVDEGRVANEDLLVLTLDRLQEKESITYERKNYSFTVRNGDASADFTLAQPYSLQQFVQHIVLISDLLTSPNKNGEEQEYGDLHQGRFTFLNTLLMALDPHSSLLDRFLYKELRQGTEGSFGGLGVVVGIKENLLTVIKPIPKSPAARAGIRKKDKIIMINNTSTYGVTLESLVEHMRGEPGTLVHLSLMRGGAYAPQNISLKREIIEVDSVTPYLVEREGYRFLRLAIESFSARTSREVRDLIMKYERTEDIAGIILDLRSNPGGLLDQAVNVSDLFLTTGSIVSTKGRRVEIEDAGIGYSEFRHPMIVLINGDSASASEIVAGALRDNNRAIIVGQPSFGKGSVQTIFELPKDQALKLTIARYYTPSGHSIQNRGIFPDIWLQPIVSFEHNRNLMGDYRYRTERFLRNSLKAEKSQDEKQEWSMLGYYLVEEINDAPLDSEGDSDLELGLSIDILEKIAVDYGVPVNVGSGRASHFLARYHEFIKQKVAVMGAETSAWLQKSHKIDWAHESGKSTPRDKIDLVLNYSKKVIIGQQNSVKANWQVTNRSENVADRISFFIQSKGLMRDTTEFLVGRIAPGETKQGQVSIPILGGKSLTRILMSSGLSQDGVPIFFSGEDKVVNVIQGASSFGNDH